MSISVSAPTPATYGDRVQRAMRHAGLSRAGLADKAGFSTKTAERHESAERPPKHVRQSVERIAEATGVRQTWLLTGDGPMLDGGSATSDQPTGSDGAPGSPPSAPALASGDPSASPADLPPRRSDVRVYDVEAGAGDVQIIGRIVSPEDRQFDRLMRVEPEDWRMLIGYAPDKPFSIRVRGESMLPWLRDGGAVWCEPCERFGPPGRYVVSYGEGLLVKRVHVRRPGRVDLISDNPAFPTIRLQHIEGHEFEDLDDRERLFVRVLGRVIYPTDDGQAVFGQLAEFARRVLSDR